MEGEEWMVKREDGGGGVDGEEGGWRGRSGGRGVDEGGWMVKREGGGGGVDGEEGGWRGRGGWGRGRVEGEEWRKRSG